MKNGCVTRARRELEHFAHSGSGHALVELAFAAPVLIMLAVGGFDFGMAFQQKQRLIAAANAGTQLAFQQGAGQEIEVSDIIARVREEAGDTTTPYAVTVDTATGYYCLCQGQTTKVDCSAQPSTVCPASITRQLEGYVQVVLSRDFKLIFPYPGVSDTLRLQVSSDMRVY